MYISSTLTENRKEVLVWERTKEGGRQQRRFEVPYYFYIRSETGKYKDIYGNKLTRLEFDNYPSYKQAIERYKNQGEKLYESDIRAEYKVLAENYINTQLPDTHITFFDIEVDYDKTKGYSDVEDRSAPINAIALHHYWNSEDVVLVVPPPNRKGVTVDDLGIHKEYPNVKIIICRDEKELLQLFFKYIEDSDILSGWNSAFFDIPYIYERAKRVLGEITANSLCFPGAPPPKYRETFDKKGIAQLTLDIFGRESVDYLEIFRKFEVVDRPSFALEAISEELFPDMKKLDYEGSLYDLYRDDFEHFIRYNIRDCELLKALEDDLGYMQLAIQFAHSSTGMLRDVVGTIKLAELAIINACHNINHAIVPDSNPPALVTEKFMGALVLPPKVGMHKRVAAVDLASLYPSTIRTLNISPETVVGQFFDTYKAFDAISAETDEQLFFKFETGEMVEKSAKEWKEYLRANNCSLSGYGTVFDLKVQGFIPAILADWFAQRKAYKKRASIAKDAMKKHTKGTEEYNKLKHEYDNCHRLQYVFKIRLNSLYGALGNPFFKFYDVRLAESTTRSGQAVLMHMVRKVAELMDGIYAYPSESTIYSDTDSCYFLTHADSNQQAVQVGKAIESAVNKSFPQFTMDAFFCTGDFTKMLSAELDLIASNSIFIKKKMYVMQLCYSEGSEVDKIKLMGVQLKKTTIPKPISTKLSGFVQDLLKDRDWREISEEIVNYKDYLIDDAKIVEIGLPKGIKGLNEKEDAYRQGDTSITLSGHAAASLFYNLCLEKYGDTESMKIRSGMKIRTYYLTKQFGRFKSIALPTDLKHVPGWFTEHFSGIIDREAQVERLIDNPLDNILTAIEKSVPTRKNMLYDDLVEY